MGLGRATGFGRLEKESARSGGEAENAGDFLMALCRVRPAEKKWQKNKHLKFLSLKYSTGT